MFKNIKIVTFLFNKIGELYNDDFYQSFFQSLKTSHIDENRYLEIIKLRLEVEMLKDAINDLNNNDNIIGK